MPKFMFDGTLLFTTSRLSPDDGPIILTSTMEKEKINVKISIKLVGEIASTDAHFVQFFNIMLRSASWN